METRKSSRTFFGVKSKASPDGFLFNFCPFCGTDFRPRLKKFFRDVKGARGTVRNVPDDIADRVRRDMGQ